MKIGSRRHLRTLPAVFIHLTDGVRMIIIEGQLEGAFKGFKGRDTIFEFVGGQVWQQAEYKYHYHYAYMPTAKVVDEGGRYVMHVEGMNDSVEVRHV